MSIKPMPSVTEYSSLRQCLKKIIAPIIATTLIVKVCDLAIMCIEGHAGAVLYNKGIVKDIHTAEWLNDLDCGYNLTLQSPTLRTIGNMSKALYVNFLFRPTNEFIDDFANKDTFDVNTLKLISHIALEEFAFRGLLQQGILPEIAKRLPKQIGEILNHRVARIAISTLLFALAHVDKHDHPLGIWNDLTSGFLLGYLAEMKHGCIITFLTHGLNNYLNHVKFD